MSADAFTPPPRVEPGTPTVHQALAAVMRGVTSVAKRDTNTQSGYNFRGIDAVVNAVGPVLREHGVIVVPIVESSDYSTVEVGRNRTQMGYVRVTVTYRWYGPDGSSIDTRTIGEAMDSGDKAAPKAMSVAFRTALLQALALPTDEPDPDSQSYERAPAGPTQEELEALRARARGLRDKALEATTKDDLSAVWKEAGPAVLAVEVPNENGDEEQLGALIKRRGAEMPADPTEEATSE